jgi:paraquat-inducible protein B
LSPDLRYVIVDIQLADFATGFAAQGAEFWVVRPQITASGVRGIETLTSGSYIGALPGRGPETNLFRGLSEDPEHSSDSNALHLMLIANSVAKLQEGSAVQYRGVDIGQVELLNLDLKNDNVQVFIYIKGPYRGLINSSTKFTYQSGIDASFSLANGARLSVGSLPTILNGAIQITTPDRKAPSLNTKMPLRLNGTETSDSNTGIDSKAGALKLTLHAHKISKLQPGAPVEYKGIVVGQVNRVRLNSKDDDIMISLSIDAPHRNLINSSTKFWYSNGVKVDFGLLSGAKLEMSSLPVLLNGAVEFTTPDKNADPVDNKYSFPLYDSYDKNWEN